MTRDRINPFAGDDGDDPAFVALAQGGSREALERLVARHQPWIYNIALRMLYFPHDAEDATQEILIKLLTKLSTFQGASSFRTWLYRLAVNHLLNIKREKLEPPAMTFSSYARGLDQTPDLDLPDPSHVPADLQLLVQEAKIGCTSGMLLCLDARQRLVYVLGEIFGVTDVVGAQILEVTRDSFRQQLARARRDLHRFMHGQCGLVNASNPCRCARKARGFMNVGYLDPGNLLFARRHLVRVRDVAPKASDDLDALDAAYAEIHREHPFQDGPDFVATLRQLLDRPELKSIVDPRWARGEEA